jgi:flagellar biogenesis protein FliO
MRRAGVVIRFTLACLLLASWPASGQDGSSVGTFPFRQASASEELAPHRSAAPRKLAPRKSNSDRSVNAASPKPSTTIGTVVSSLAIVLGLFLALVWCSRRFSPAGTAPLPKEAVELLGRAALSGKQTMQLIRVGNRLLLVALSNGGAQTLTEIRDPVEVEHLAGLCQRGRGDSATASFHRVLSQMASESEVQSRRSRTRGAT